jgi:hypothetical protein
MARSAYIYFVRIKNDRSLLGCFTVKREARTWAKRWCGEHYPLERLQLSSMHDGLNRDKKETAIPWDKP